MAFWIRLWSSVTTETGETAMGVLTCASTNVVRQMEYCPHKSLNYHSSLAMDLLQETPQVIEQLKEHYRRTLPHQLPCHRLPQILVRQHSL